MKRSKVCVAVGLIVSWLIVPLVQSAQPVKEEGHTIFGIVQELRSGTADVPVCLCDGETGLPLLEETYQLIDFGKSDPDGLADKTAIAVTNKNGEFSFENVPDGKYRLLAQKWFGPYKGIFELHGTVIQLMGHRCCDCPPPQRPLRGSCCSEAIWRWHRTVRSGCS